MIDPALLEALSRHTLSDATAGGLPEQSPNQMILAESLFAPGQEIYLNLHTQDVNTSPYFLHGHDFFEMNYMVRGAAVNRLGEDQAVQMDLHTLCVMNPLARHNLYVEHQEDMVLNIALKPSLFNSTFWSLIEAQSQLGDFFLNYFMASDTSRKYMVFQFERSDNLDHMLSDILREYLCPRPFSQISLHCLIILFFTEIMRQNMRLLNAQTFRSRQEVQIAALFQYLSKNYATATLASTAAFFHYHPNYLSRMIKKSTGRTYQDIVNDIRATQCTYYLVNTNLPLSEISERLGFSQLCNFYAFTKKNFQMTPLQYRQKCGGNVSAGPEL